MSVPRDYLNALNGPTGAGQRPTLNKATIGTRFYDATAFSLGNLSPQPTVQSFLYPIDNPPAMDFLLPGPDAPRVDTPPGAAAAAAPRPAAATSSRARRARTSSRAPPTATRSPAAVNPTGSSAGAATTALRARAAATASGGGGKDSINGGGGYAACTFVCTPGRFTWWFATRLMSQYGMYFSRPTKNLYGLSYSNQKHTVSLWKTTNSRIESEPELNIEKAIFSADSRYVSLRKSGEWRGRLWRLQSGRLMPTKILHQSLDSEPLFSPDGQYLYVTALDGTGTTGQLWNLSGDQPRLHGRFSGLDVFAGVVFDTRNHWMLGAGRNPIPCYWPIYKPIVSALSDDLSIAMQTGCRPLFRLKAVGYC